MSSPLRPRLLGPLLALGLALGFGTLPAGADPVAGASYAGVADDGATVNFRLSPDGTLVDSFQVRGVQAVGGCGIYANGDSGFWEGAPITEGTFDYRYYDTILFRGAFPGPQSAAGVFRLYQRATSGAAACDSGTVNWTATTTAAPPPGAGGPAGTGASSGGGSGGGDAGRPGASNAQRRFGTRVALRRAKRTKRLGGKVTSHTRACSSGRTMILWRGARRIASTRSKADGSYSFALSAALRGRRVRASSPAVAVTAGICEAGSSSFIRA